MSLPPNYPCIETTVKLSQVDAGFKFCRVVPCEAFLNLATAVINHLEKVDQAKGGHSWTPGINDNGWRLKYVFFPILLNSASMSL